MKVIHQLLLFILLILSQEAMSVLVVNEVVVNCGSSIICSNQKKRFDPLKETYRNITHLRQTLKIVVSSGGVRDFTWDLTDTAAGRSLNIFFEPKYNLGTVQVVSSDSKLQEYIERNFKLQQGSWFEQEALENEIFRIKQFLNSKGYPKAEIKAENKIKDLEQHLVLEVIPGRPQLLKSIQIKTESIVVREFAEQKLHELLGRNFDVQEARLKTDELEAELFSYGYYLATIALTPKKSGQDVIVEAIIGPVDQWVFDLVTPPAPYEDVKIEFGSIVRSLFKRYRRAIDESTLKVGIFEYLRTQGYLSPEVKLNLKRYQTNRGDWVNAAKVEILAGHRTRVRKVTFPGAQYWPESKLKKLWDEQASEQLQSGFFDETSQNSFSEWLRGQYIRYGFVRAEIPTPRISFANEGKDAELEYAIKEGVRVYVDEIKLTGVNENESVELLEKIETKQGSPFNPFQFTEDIKKISESLQENGWYQADVVNRDDEDIVNYGTDRTSVKLNLKIRKGKFITFNRLVIVGNKVTKGSVIRRKSPFSRGKPITPNQVKDFENVLGSLGIFSSVKVKPIFHKGETALSDIVVEVSERDYGLIEIAPGYRTDIGIKLSGTVSWLNLFGENISSSLTGQVNQRLDNQAFDKRRRDEDNKLLEYNISSQFNVPDLEETSIDYGVALSFQRRRFFSFDADIRRLSNTISRDLGTRFSLSLRHQFESINQFDATEKRDNGSFEIGALTPSFTADFRNTRINPTAGAWFNISNEFANPYFLSQKQDDLTINFYKLISRNRFYIPIPKGTIAVSMVGGIQENLAKGQQRDSDGQPIVQDGIKLTEGYIPNIKLFRLTGTDIVRGYSDEEINRLTNGEDIGEGRVQNKAYMANLKVEPRYFINDTLMAGIFFDAGRVYVDTVDIGELRQSVGFTFKVVTPVGTLDFDYGIKLLRKRDLNGNLEAPGRFHVSIGFF
jgi:outer membrane protein insertion porin family